MIIGLLKSHEFDCCIFNLSFCKSKSVIIYAYNCVIINFGKSYFVQNIF